MAAVPPTSASIPTTSNPSPIILIFQFIMSPPRSDGNEQFVFPPVPPAVSIGSINNNYPGSQQHIAVNLNAGLQANPPVFNMGHDPSGTYATHPMYTGPGMYSASGLGVPPPYGSNIPSMYAAGPPAGYHYSSDTSPTMQSTSHPTVTTPPRQNKKTSKRKSRADAATGEVVRTPARTPRRRRQEDPAAFPQAGPLASQDHTSLSQPLSHQHFPAIPQSAEGQSVGAPPLSPTPAYRSAQAQEKKKPHPKSAKDIEQFFRYDEADHRMHCIFCEEASRTVDSNTAASSANYATSSGTSTRRDHLMRVHLRQWVLICEQKNIPITAAKVRGKVTQMRQKLQAEAALPQATTSVMQPRRQFTSLGMVDRLVDVIVANDLSINLIESPELRALILDLRPELNDPDIAHRTTVHKQIMVRWELCLQKLEHEMKNSMGKISFTMDIWTSPELVPFMATTAHWIERKEVLQGSSFTYELFLRADLIGFHQIPGHHTGEHLMYTFLHMLDRIKITAKIGWITLDNASNNNTFVNSLMNELQKRGISFKSDQRRIRCFPHIVNLACQAIVKSMTTSREPESQVSTSAISTRASRRDPISLLRSLIHAFRKSSLRREHFGTVVTKILGHNLQLLRDVETRWSSTLLMIERALELRQAIDEFIKHSEFPELKVYQLSDTEWRILDVYREILMTPHDFQQRLSSEQTPTLCDVVPAFGKIVRLWNLYKEQNPAAAGIVNIGLAKVTEYEDRAHQVESNILAMIINPRYKLAWYSKFAPAEEEHARQTFLRALRDYYQVPAPAPANQDPFVVSSSAPSQAPIARALTASASGTLSEWERQLREDDYGFESSQSGFHNIDMEAHAYLSDPWSGTQSTSFLQYWQDNCHRYPTIFALAMDIIPIQGSSVPCERVFSSSKETTTARRNRLSANTLEALQMLKYSIRNRRLEFMRGTSRADETEELEYDMQVAADVPEDISAFTLRLQEQCKLL